MWSISTRSGPTNPVSPALAKINSCPTRTGYGVTRRLFRWLFRRLASFCCPVYGEATAVVLLITAAMPCDAQPRVASVRKVVWMHSVQGALGRDGCGSEGKSAPAISRIAVLCLRVTQFKIRCQPSWLFGTAGMTGPYCSRSRPPLYHFTNSYEVPTDRLSAAKRRRLSGLSTDEPMQPL